MARFIVLLMLEIFCLCNGVRDEKFFKVPVDRDQRMKDRPLRLTDNVEDPQMVKLKMIEDKFFDIINDSIGPDFKGISQVLQIIDNDAGKEAGKLMMNGAMLALSTGKSYQLYEEFLDDFKYKGPDGLMETMVDYSDFMKGVDVSMIPMTLEVLFRKDHLGNSLAQMPLGQLVDLVQPEASKYGIDIRSFIDGILGKGDSKFPELMHKIIHNFNVTNIMNSVVGSMPTETTHELKEKMIGSKKSNNFAQLFKPFVARMLRENQIDLEADAVIQVMQPFIDAITNMANQDNLLPLIAGVSGLISGRGGNMDLQSIMNVASQFMGNNKQNSKQDSPLLDMLAPLLAGNHLDPQMLLGFASQMMGQQKNGGFNMMEMLDVFDTETGTVDTQKVMKKAMNLMNGFTPPKGPPKTPPKPVKIAPKVQESNDLIDIMENSIGNLKHDKTMNSKINGVWTYLEQLLKQNGINLKELHTVIPTLIKTATGGSVPDGIDLEMLNAMVTAPEEQWRETLIQLENDDLRETVVNSAAVSATQMITVMTHEQFLEHAYKTMDSKIQETFSSFGITDITLDNFPDKLMMPISMLLMPFNLKINVKSQLGSIQESLKYTKHWFEKTLKSIAKIPRHKLANVVSKSLDKDVISTLVKVFKMFDTTQDRPNCFLKHLCLYIEETDDDTLSLQSLMTRLFGIGFGFTRAVQKENLTYAFTTMKICTRSSYNCEANILDSCASIDSEPAEKGNAAMNPSYDDLRDEL